MKTETREIYKCDHCKKLYQVKRACAKHEDNCTRNPKNIAACSGCVFIEQRPTEYWYDTGYGEFSGKSIKFHCKKLDKDLYPHKVVRTGLLERYPENFEDQEQMPTTCEHRDDINF